MDNKKKKNKKKKGNNPSKLTDDVPANAEQVVVPNQDNGSYPHLNHLSQVSSAVEIRTGMLPQSDIEPDKHKVSSAVEIRTGMLPQSDIEPDKHKVSSAVEIRTDRLPQSDIEPDKHKVSLEEKIQLLQSDVDSCLKKEASFEEKFKSLQSGNDLLIQKQAIFEDRVNCIEGIKDSWILKETMINEMASRWDDVNLKLQEQVKEVKELKESRDELGQENAKLREGIAVIESRLQYIETKTFLSTSSDVMIPKQSSVEETPQSDPETASSLPSDVQEHEKTEAREKQSSVEETPQSEPETASLLLSDMQEHEKTEVVEKLKEVRIEIDRENKSTESSVSIDGHAPKYGKEMYESVEMIPSLVRTSDPFGIPNGAEDFGTVNGRMDIPRISEDVVSVPLDDIQAHEVQPPSEEEEEIPLPISDAPLIGAPFRLISFFAKYVSGADLVHRDGD